MKLLRKNNLYYFFFSLLAYLGIGIAFYAVTEYLIYDEVERRLQAEKRDFQEYVARNGDTWHFSYFVENKINFEKTTAKATSSETFNDTLLYDKYSHAAIRFRQLNFYSRLGGQLYLVHLRKSLLESDKLLKYLTGTLLVLLSIAFVGMYFFQRIISKKLWKPFYSTLSMIRAFDLSMGKRLYLSKSGIYEFNELNDVLEKMSEKMRTDYMNLKEFTENASHEIQTPLALIHARVEELIQSQHTEKDNYLINEIHNATVRLSKLSNALLLLSKIENGQFPDIETVDFDTLILRKLREFEEIFSHHALTVTYSQSGRLMHDINAALADVLMTNLIGNAVKHNTSPGKIDIALHHNRFEILNTGMPLQTDPSSLFQRFKKGRRKPDSSGLGLAIVMQVCTNYGLSVDYYYKEGMHCIKVGKK